MGHAMLRSTSVLLLLTALVLTSQAAVHKVHFTDAEGAKLVNQTVHIKTGDTLMCTFFGLLSTGFSWVNASSPHHLRFSDFLKQEVPPDNFIWNYTALGPGKDKLIFTNGEPWMP